MCDDEAQSRKPASNVVQFSKDLIAVRNELHLRPKECHIQTDAFNWQKPDNRHFRDQPLTGHAADMPKSTQMTQC